MKDYDFIIVGAGSAGCVLAARLSASGQYQVALIEAGGSAERFWINTPIGFGRLYEDPKSNWLYQSEPELELNNTRSFQSRGKVLGGTSSINGLVYMRGQQHDFNQWKALGNYGWGYEDVLAFFKKSEKNQNGANYFHGDQGPLGVSNSSPHELADAFLAAGVQAGYELNKDLNGSSQDGFGYIPMTTYKGQRSSSASAYLKPIRNRKNLHIITKALVTRILFNHNTAIGIQYLHQGLSCHIQARREVIVSGGVFNSPQLLELSGIGQAKRLETLGIPVKVDLPGVGENLQDHFTASVTYRCTKKITLNDIINQPLRRIGMGIQYLLTRSGPMASGGVPSVGCLRSDPTELSPDIKLNLQLWGRSSTGKAKKGLDLLPFSSFGISMNLLHPESRGHVHIKNNNPLTAPSIQFNFFSTENDRRKAIYGIKEVRRLAKTTALKPYIQEEITPGPQFQTENELQAYCRSAGRSTHHGTSTCKMGIDKLAVVDPQLKVIGINQLRIIDASIMPNLVGGNTNAATIMIGEKGASMLLKDHESIT